MYVTVTRKTMAAVTAFLIVLIIVIAEFTAASQGIKDGATNKQRLDFIAALGVETDDEVIDTAKISIPLKFSDVYEGYNAVQMSAGYDLSDYKGCTVTRYTYAVKGSERVINILVYRGRIIGGDISSLELGGEMMPLKGINDGKTKA